MEKKEMRKKVLQTMSELSREEHALRSRAILSGLLDDPAFQSAKTVGMTISRHPEVDTLQIIEACWRLGKQVAAPKCSAELRTMDFRLIERLDQLEVVYMDLKEPIEAVTTSVEAQAIDLLIVPGVVFTEEGYRIGFGGGYYDRFLADYRGVTRSLAFELQMAEEIPIESHDIPVDAIITDRRVINAKAVRA